MQKFSYKHFRLRVPASYLGHVVAACFLVVYVCHIELQM
jgi:hypothetical protein